MGFYLFNFLNQVSKWEPIISGFRENFRKNPFRDFQGKNRWIWFFPENLFKGFFLFPYKSGVFYFFFQFPVTVVNFNREFFSLMGKFNFLVWNWSSGIELTILNPNPVFRFGVFHCFTFWGSGITPNPFKI